MAKIAEVQTTYFKTMTYDVLSVFVMEKLLPSIENEKEYPLLVEQAKIVRESGTAYRQSIINARYDADNMIAKKQKAKTALITVLTQLSLDINAQAKGYVEYVTGTCMKAKKKAQRSTPYAEKPDPVTGLSATSLGVPGELDLSFTVPEGQNVQNVIVTCCEEGSEEWKMIGELGDNGGKLMGFPSWQVVKIRVYAVNPIGKSEATEIGDIKVM